MTRAVVLPLDQYGVGGTHAPTVMVGLATVCPGRAGVTPTPLGIYFPPGYPAQAPYVVVEPLPRQRLACNNAIAPATGAVNLRYLQQWDARNSTLSELVTFVSSLFYSASGVEGDNTGGGNGGDWGRGEAAAGAGVTSRNSAVRQPPAVSAAPLRPGTAGTGTGGTGIGGGGGGVESEDEQLAVALSRSLADVSLYSSVSNLSTHSSAKYAVPASSSGSNAGAGSGAGSGRGMFATASDVAIPGPAPLSTRSGNLGTTGAGAGAKLSAEDEAERAGLEQIVAVKAETALNAHARAATAEAQDLAAAGRALAAVAAAATAAARAREDAAGALASAQAGADAQVRELRAWVAAHEQALASSNTTASANAAGAKSAAGGPDVNASVAWGDPIAAALAGAVCDDMAAEDALTALDELLEDECVDVTEYLKEVRKVAKQQFLARAAQGRVAQVQREALATQARVREQMRAQQLGGPGGQGGQLQGLGQGQQAGAMPGQGQYQMR